MAVATAGTAGTAAGAGLGAPRRLTAPRRVATAYSTQGKGRKRTAPAAVDAQDDADILKVMPLGAGQEVGRSCVVVNYKGKTIMLDCGLHPAHDGIAGLPFFDQIDPASVDLLLITHFHLDHAAALPYFVQRTNFRGRIFMTHPTRAIFRWLLTDYVKVQNIASSEEMLYDDADLEATYNKIEVIDFHQRLNVNGVKFTAYNAGHVLGAAMFLLEIAGVKLLYTGDYSREEDRHLMAAERPPHVQMDVLVCESTYGVQSHQPRLDREARFTKMVHDVVERGGRCLIPVFALGRAQELLLILEEYWQAHPELHNVPIYYASALAKKCMMVYQTYTNMMNDHIRERAKHGNPFQFRHVSHLPSMRDFDDVGPCVMLAAPGMLQSGLSRELLEIWSPDRRNGVIIPGYVVEGTLGKAILARPTEIPSLTTGGKLPLRLSVDYISFSAHVDFRENAEFIDDVDAPHLILVHGAAHEMTRLRSALTSKYSEMPHRNMTIYCPRNCETVELFFEGEKVARTMGRLAATAAAAIEHRPSRSSGRGHADHADHADADDVIDADHADHADHVDETVLNGVLVCRDYTYRFLAPEDLPEYTPLKTTTLTQTQTMRCHIPLSLLTFHLRQMYGDVEAVGKAADGDTAAVPLETRTMRDGVWDIIGRFRVFDAIDLACLRRAASARDGVAPDAADGVVFPGASLRTTVVEMVELEWRGTSLNDVVADSILAIIVQAESSPASIKVSSQQAHTHDHGHHDTKTSADGDVSTRAGGEAAARPPTVSEASAAAVEPMVMPKTEAEAPARVLRQTRSRTAQATVASPPLAAVKAEPGSMTTADQPLTPHLTLLTGSAPVTTAHVTALPSKPAAAAAPEAAPEAGATAAVKGKPGSAAASATDPDLDAVLADVAVFAGTPALLAATFRPDAPATGAALAAALQTAWRIQYDHFVAAVTQQLGERYGAAHVTALAADAPGAAPPHPDHWVCRWQVVSGGAVMDVVWEGHAALFKTVIHGPSVPPGADVAADTPAAPEASPAAADAAASRGETADGSDAESEFGFGEADPQETAHAHALQARLQQEAADDMAESRAFLQATARRIVHQCMMTYFPPRNGIRAT
ncbi:hypothetical protein CXG81DRAFT_25654 [Caulochytrium protostelioides]|uniref:Endoribonuclease YSH1 n=1 Tax=Caulochytrium protostelioides TaxID=1555241 RepID=A0A4P9X8S4_9FUNG|nr:hypothetical protein CXG81DRAFT_25654 [Caulochytrium protostelioides]|eukprot:RKP01686.1 hypothetical protein CXG81DRAFT_25654 [Caulochytrium protostelioides]